MGRGKITMKYIKNEKFRKQSFKQRKNGLIIFFSQFTMKTGAKACLIVYDDDGNNVGPITWPEDHTMVNSMLQEYEHQKIEKTSKIFNVNDYFEIKKAKVEAEITKVHKDIINIKYPTWHPDLVNMEASQLRDFIALVDAKIQACDHKINMLKSEMVEENVVLNPSHHTSSKNQLDDINEMVDSTDLGDFPSTSSVNQLKDLFVLSQNEEGSVGSDGLTKQKDRF